MPLPIRLCIKNSSVTSSSHRKYRRHIYNLAPFPPHLSPHITQLQPPQPGKRHARKGHRKPNSNIRPPGIPHQLRYRPHIPRLIHTNNGPGPPNQKTQQRRPPNRQIRLILPPLPLEPASPAQRPQPAHAEQDVFLQHDGDEDHDPIPHQREEVLEDLEQVIAPGDGADEVDEHDEADPDVARHHLPVAAQDLAPQRRGVSAGDVVGDDAERDDDAAEFAEVSNRGVAFEDQGAGGDAVGGLPRWVGKGPAG